MRVSRVRVTQLILCYVNLLLKSIFIMTRAYSSSGSIKGRDFRFSCCIYDLSGKLCCCFDWLVYNHVPQLSVNNLCLLSGQFRYELTLFINRAIMALSSDSPARQVSLFNEYQLD